jgi:hypothetical protein
MPHKQHSPIEIGTRLRVEGSDTVLQVVRLDTSTGASVAHTFSSKGEEQPYLLSDLATQLDAGQLRAEEELTDEIDRLAASTCAALNREDRQPILMARLELVRRIDDAITHHGESVASAIERVRADLIRDTHRATWPSGLETVPCTRSLRNWHRDRLQPIKLVPYASRVDQMSRGPLAHPRTREILTDVLDSAINAATPDEFGGSFDNIRREVNEQLADERRLHSLGFVRLQEQPGSRHRRRLHRPSLQVCLDPVRGKAVAYNSGGDLWYRPLRAKDVEPLRNHLLRPESPRLDDSRRLNKPYYEERDLTPQLRSIDLPHDIYLEKLHQQEPCSSMRDIYQSCGYRFFRGLSPFERDALRNGRHHALINTRPKTGSGPIYEPDAIWRADYFTQDVIGTDDSGDYPIGRLHVALITDAATYYCPGVAIGFSEDHGLLAAALRIALSDKADLLARLGIEAPWACGHIPGLIGLDNAAANMSHDLILGLGRHLHIDATYKPLGDPRVQGVVENRIGMVNRALHCLQGVTFSDPRPLQRWDYNPKTTAILPQSILNRTIARIIAEVVNHNPLPVLGGLTPHDSYVSRRRNLGVEDRPLADPSLLRLIGYYTRANPVTRDGVLAPELELRYRFQWDSRSEGSLIGATDGRLVIDPWDLTRATLTLPPPWSRVIDLIIHPSQVALVDRQTLWSWRETLGTRTDSRRLFVAGKEQARQNLRQVIRDARSKSPLANRRTGQRPPLEDTRSVTAGTTDDFEIVYPLTPTDRDGRR